MRAAFYETNGSARDVLRVADIPTPDPGPGEVRVRLSCSGVNPSDVKTRAGSARPMMFPRVTPQSDGAGEIDAVGTGVSPARLGERVWIWNGQWRRPFGTAAEFIVLPAVQAVRLPDRTSFAEASCFGIPALTAWRAVDLAGGCAGQLVLVAGGAGAVGHYAIQFAKAAGAEVITTVSSPAKAAHAAVAGADHIIDYRREDVAGRVREISGGRGVDRIIEVDLKANAGLDTKCLRQDGMLAIYGSGGWDAALPLWEYLAAGTALHFLIVYNLAETDRRRGIAALHDLLETGRLRHAVAAHFPLERIVEAHEAVESGQVMGNVVLDIG